MMRLVLIIHVLFMVTLQVEAGWNLYDIPYSTPHPFFLDRKIQRMINKFICRKVCRCIGYPRPRWYPFLRNAEHAFPTMSTYPFSINNEVFSTISSIPWTPHSTTPFRKTTMPSINALTIPDTSSITMSSEKYYSTLETTPINNVVNPGDTRTHIFSSTTPPNAPSTTTEPGTSTAPSTSASTTPTTASTVTTPSASLNDTNPVNNSIEGENHIIMNTTLPKSSTTTTEPQTSKTLQTTTTATSTSTTTTTPTTTTPEPMINDTDELYDPEFYNAY